jgi:hypothetical protein
LDGRHAVSSFAQRCQEWLHICIGSSELRSSLTVHRGRASHNLASLLRDILTTNAPVANKHPALSWAPKISKIPSFSQGLFDVAQNDRAPFPVFSHPANRADLVKLRTDGRLYYLDRPLVLRIANRSRDFMPKMERWRNPLIRVVLA